MKDFFLIIAGAVTVACVIPYIRDILKGTTKPNIVSWLTWTILTGVATVAEIADGEYRTAVFTGTAVLETTLIVILGLKYGITKYTKFDVVCQVGAIMGFILWWLLDSPAAAVISVVAIDFIAALPTLRHSWISPAEETWVTFALAGLGGLFAIFALHEFNYTSLTYAVYIVGINTVFTAVILSRKNMLRSRT